MMSVLVVRGDRRARRSADRTTYDSAIPSANFVTDGGTDTASDGTPNGGIDGIVTCRGKGRRQKNQSRNQNMAHHFSVPKEGRT